MNKALKVVLWVVAPVGMLIVWLGDRLLFTDRERRLQKTKGIHWSWRA